MTHPLGAELVEMVRSGSTPDQVGEWWDDMVEPIIRRAIAIKVGRRQELRAAIAAHESALMNLNAQLLVLEMEDA